jgi:UDP-N-acetylglucosamine:LPS N-acetylglucosamine transferase
MVAKENDINFLSIPVLKLPNTKSPKVFLYPFFLILGFIRARRLIKKISNNDNGTTCVFSKG